MTAQDATNILARDRTMPADPPKAAVKKSTRRRAGLYAVRLTNGAEATVSINGAVDGDAGTGLWQWDDECGGCGGFDYKREAIASFIDYRG